MVPLWGWGAFVAAIVALLVVDLRVVMADAETVSTRKAAWYSAGWVSLGLAFTAVVFFALGGDAAVEYVTGYLIEKSLSVDNVFVWAVIFTYFAVPDELEHRVLFWGVFGALVFRAVFIFAGVALLEAIDWITYVFGALLLFTAWRVARHGGEEVDPEKNPVLRRLQDVLPQTDDYRGKQFLVTENGKTLVTPLLIVLITIEFTDVLFAVDSIPAILAVTRDEFIVFSSNAFAILGLRALYFLLGGLKDRFVHLNKGLAVILAFVGAKFIVEHFIEIPIYASLAFVAAVLAVTIWLSLRSTGDSSSREDARSQEATRPS